MEAPNKNYERFFQKFLALDSTQIKDWDKNLVLAYFCKKYKEKYNEDYKFKFNTQQPSSCFEIYVINKLYINLSSNPETLKLYIDFVFDTKIKNAKRKITSVNTLCDEKCLYTFKTKYLQNKIQASIDRTSMLDQQVINKIKHINENILTWGDLAFMIQSESEESFKIKEQLKDFNFDDLSRVI